jgi:hypothetical protein
MIGIFRKNLFAWKFSDFFHSVKKVSKTTVILSFLKCESERDFANVSDRSSCTV